MQNTSHDSRKGQLAPLVVSVLVALFAAACAGLDARESDDGDREVPITHWPLPTENWLDADAEGMQKSRRKEWFREMHRTAPDLDWKAMEADNGFAQMTKRNALAGRERRGPIEVASPWVERGSENQAGRMHVAAYSTDGLKLYAGSSKGGVWRQRNSRWTPIGDNLYGGAHWLAVVSGALPGDPDAVLAAQDGGTVRKTTDDGETWTVPMGLPSFSNVRRVMVASDGSETTFVVGRAGGQYGVWRSTDGLASFTQVRNLGSFAGDLWTPRTGASDVYTVNASSILKSVNLGDTWTTVGTTPSGSSAVELCGSEAGAPRLWGVFSRSGAEQLHRSDDEGSSWTYIQDLTDYWGSLNASILNPNLFAYGGVEVWRTTDGGTSFSKVNAWGEYYGNPVGRLHADIPGIDVWPGGPAGETWFVATDGGLYQSKTQLASVQNISINGLRVSQYYSTHTSTVDPNHVVAGAQDQGYQFASTGPPVNHTRLEFDQIISGDYGHITSGNGSHHYLFSTYPGFILAQVGEWNPALYQVSFPNNENNSWLPPVVADPLDKRDFFFCATRIWYYQKRAVVNVWDKSLWSTHDFETTSGEYVSALTFSPVDSNRAYAATNRGKLYYSDDHGVSWTQSSNSGPSAHYFYGTALVASSLDADTVWVGGSGYGSPAVYRSTDGGQTFQAWGTGLPSTLVYCLGEAPDGSGTVFCGTENAAYMRESAASNWIDITAADAPITTYWSVEPLPHENTMRFGTYGRGIWDYQIDPQAVTLRFNGSGSNALCFTNVAPPELGGTWSVEVDASGHPGATLTGFLIYTAPSAGTFVSGGELLVDRTSPFLLQVLGASGGGIDGYTLPVPNDPALAGLKSYAQAFVLGGGYELCNRLDVVIGY